MSVHEYEPTTMSVFEYINSSNELYAQLFPDFVLDHDYLRHNYHAGLDNIPYVHELAHAVIGHFGGPDNNYVFTENFSVPIEIGMVQELHLLDRHLGSTFLEVRRKYLSADRSYNAVFEQSEGGKKSRYPAGKRLLGHDKNTQILYALIAYDTLEYHSQQIKSGLIEFGNDLGDVIKSWYPMELIEIHGPTGADLDYYPEIRENGKDDELAAKLLHNEAEFKRVLKSMTPEGLMDLVETVSQNHAETMTRMKELQAIFTHVVLGYTTEFCQNHYKLESGFPHAYKIWEYSEGKWVFDKERAVGILNMDFGLEYDPYRTPWLSTR